jgi:hypothetical protein
MPILQQSILFFLLCTNSLLLSAQATKPVVLTNGSFEGVPHDAVNPEGWKSCGNDSSPDILPGPWGVYQKPTKGKTYLGLITRENNTWETIYQKMSTPFRKNRCYKFKVDQTYSTANLGKQI